MGAVLERPAPGDRARPRQREHRDADLEPGALDREVAQVLLLGALERDAPQPAVPPVVPVHELAVDERGHDAAADHGQVHEADLDLVEAVRAGQLRGQHRGDAVEAREDDAAVGEQEEHVLLQQYLQRLKNVEFLHVEAAPRRGARRRARQGSAARRLGVATQATTPQELLAQLPSGAVGRVRLDRPVSHYLPAGLRQEKAVYDEHEPGQDGEEPEDPTPARVLRQDPAYHGADGWGEEDRQGREADVVASLRRGGYVGDDRLAQCYGRAGAGRLQHTQN